MRADGAKVDPGHLLMPPNRAKMRADGAKVGPGHLLMPPNGAKMEQK